MSSKWALRTTVEYLIRVCAKGQNEGSIVISYGTKVQLFLFNGMLTQLRN